MKGLQQPLFAPQTEWVPPSEFKDLSNYDEIAIDLETCDPNIKTHGSGSVVGDGNEEERPCWMTWFVGVGRREEEEERIIIISSYYYYFIIIYIIIIIIIIYILLLLFITLLLLQ